MQAQVFEGYFENGNFFTKDRRRVKIPNRFKVNLTLFNEKVDADAIVKHPEKRPFSELFGEWSGQMWMSDDFDEPLDEMRDYM